jgi:hypothetical protein
MEGCWLPYLEGVDEGAGAGAGVGAGAEAGGFGGMFTLGKVGSHSPV